MAAVHDWLTQHGEHGIKPFTEKILRVDFHQSNTITTIIHTCQVLGISQFLRTLKKYQKQPRLTRWYMLSFDLRQDPQIKPSSGK